MKLFEFFYINYIIYNSTRYKKLIKYFNYLVIFELCIDNYSTLHEVFCGCKERLYHGQV
jgi:hypothetical protein